MESIHKVNTQRRVDYVNDTIMGAQATGKDVDSYLKSLRQSAGIVEERNDTQEFLQNIGKGI